MVRPAPGWMFIMLNAYEVLYSAYTCLRAHAHIHANVINMHVHAHIWYVTYVHTNMRAAQVSILQDRRSEGYQEAV